MGMHMRVRTSARLRMRIPAQIHTYEGARPRALPEGLGFPVEKIEDMSAGEAEEHIAALYGDELYGLELDGEVSGEGAMRCACSPVHDEVRGICDMLGLDFTRVDRIATGRAGMLWAGPVSIRSCRFRNRTYAYTHTYAVAHTHTRTMEHMHVGISTHMHIAAHAPIGLQPWWAPCFRPFSVSGV